MLYVYILQMKCVHAADTIDEVRGGRSRFTPASFFLRVVIDHR